MKETNHYIRSHFIVFPARYSQDKLLTMIHLYLDENSDPHHLKQKEG